MDEFARPSSRRCALIASSLALSLAGGCVDQLDPLEGVASLRIELRTPADPGTLDDRLDPSQTAVELSVVAVNVDGQVSESFDGTIDLYSHYLGSLTPALGAVPLAQVDLRGATPAVVSLDLPLVYGPTFVWGDHSRGDNPTYAAGSSPTLWYPDAHLEDISRPRDENALGALDRSPLESKQIDVNASRYGPSGRMVVTGVYSQGYTLSDVECRDAAGTPPCVPGDYDHVYVFSFSRAEEESQGREIREGQVIDRLTGSVGEYLGLTEINFPQSFASDSATYPEMIPEPIVIQPSWLSTRIEMERAESALVALDNATVCPLDDDFETYSQWKLDIGNGCGDPINIISLGVAADFDPGAHVGEVLPRVVGTLRPINIGSFNVWLVYPRGMDDIAVTE